MKKLTLKSLRKYYLLAAFFLLIQSGCFTTSGDLEDEIKLLMENQFSASGSDLALAVCGWQPDAKLRITELKASADPGSPGGSGSGRAHIAAEGGGFTCSGDISFDYYTGYSGGHGYGSGYSSLKVGLIKRESAVPEYVSNNNSSEKITAGVTVNGELSEEGLKLPDGSLARWYYLDIDDPDPAIKVTMRSLSKTCSPRCYIYQDNEFVSLDSSSGFRVKRGRLIMMVSSGRKQCAYTLLAEKLTGEEKSVLKK